MTSGDSPSPGLGPAGRASDSALAAGTRFAAATTLLAAFGLAHGTVTLLVSGGAAVPCYLPVERRWQWGCPHPPAAVIGMDFYGRTLLALIFALAAAGVAALLSRHVLRWRLEPRSTAAALLLLNAAAGLAFTTLVHAVAPLLVAAASPLGG